MSYDFYKYLGYPTIGQVDDLSLDDTAVLVSQGCLKERQSSVECDLTSVQQERFPGKADPNPISLSMLPWALVRYELSKETTIFWVEQQGDYSYLQVTSWDNLSESRVRVKANGSEGDDTHNIDISAVIELMSPDKILLARVSISEDCSSDDWSYDCATYLYIA